MTAVVTGASGFIGQRLVRELAARGEDVIAIGRQTDRGNSREAVRWHASPATVEGWQRILPRSATIYHLAWSGVPQTSNDDPVKDASENIVSSLQLVQALKGLDGVRFVFASSGGTVYGILDTVPVNENHSTKPRCAYGVSKLAVENYLRLYRDLWGLDCVSLRISNSYGPGQAAGRNFGAVATFAELAVRGQPINVFGDGSVVRDYIYVDDVVAAMIAAGSVRGGPGAVNIGSGAGKSLNDIVDELDSMLGRMVGVNRLPSRDLDVPVSVLDITLARSALEWAPRVSFKTGVEMTVEAVRAALSAA